MGFFDFNDFQFESRNFVLGLLAGWATAFAVYQTRSAILSMRRSVSTQTDTARRYATRTAEGRYSRELIQFCEANHLFGQKIPLSKILIEPRFIAPPAFAAPPDDDVNFDVFRVAPRVHDHPYLHQPYNIETASLDELGYGDRAVALLGTPGSGRTTALQAIALWNMGLVDFTPPKDTVTLRLEAEERALKADERAARIKDRMTIEERARERLAEEQGADPGLKSERQEIVSPLRRLSPMYVHLADVRPDAYGRHVDPAEPLLRGIQHNLRYVTSKTFPRRFYERLGQGRVLMLIDGYDDLPEAQRRNYLPWLTALLDQYRRNFFIVTGPAYGYGNLLRAGLSPVFLRPWDDHDSADAVAKLAANWKQLGGRREQPNEIKINDAHNNVRGLTPLDVTLKARATYAENETDDESTPGDWMKAHLDDLGLSAEQLIGAARAAALQLDTGFITETHLIERALGAVGTGVAGASLAMPISDIADEDVDAIFQADADDEDVDALFEGESVDDTTVEDVGDSEASPAPKPDKAASKSDRKENSQVAKAQSQLIAALVRMGLLVKHSGDHYRFRNAPTAAYLASLTLDSATSAQMVEKAELPSWDMALAYAAGHTSVEPAVKARLSSHPDVLYNHVFNTARWLAYAGGRAEWRATIMKQLGNLFIVPAQYPLLRERTAAALVGTRDKSVLVVFQRGLKSPDPDVRRLSCLALGVLREDRAVDAIAGLMDDKDVTVQLAAALALGAIGTDEAYENMAVTLTSGSEPLRQVIAETFAAIPEPGYETLYEAVTADDLLLRRAAVFGLRRVRTPWALIAIYRVFLGEPQFYVKSAAQQAFLDMQNNVIAQSLRSYPQPETIPWLQESLSGGETPADQALTNALHEGGPSLQTISAQAIGQLGMANQVSDLYQALLYREPTVRDAAHRALANLQLQIGQTLPAPA